jgi:V8-like Glu-specific endopeptidase
MHPVSKTLRCGTAILLSDNIVITPAHNVYDREGKVFYSNYRFEIEKEEPFGVVDYGMIRDYATANSRKKGNMYDFAVLHLERSAKSIKSLSCLLNTQGKR